MDRHDTDRQATAGAVPSALPGAATAGGRLNASGGAADPAAAAPAGTADGTAEGGRWGIAELAAAFDLTPRTIRFYEDEGLIAPARAGQVRIYGRADRARLALICRGKRLGFSLAEIREFLDLYDVDRGQVGQMSFLLGKARERIAALERQQDDVRRTLAELRGLEAAIVEHLSVAGPADRAGPPGGHRSRRSQE